MCESNKATSVASNNAMVATVPDEEEQTANARRERNRDILFEELSRGDEECPHYPLTREELRVLARYWSNHREHNRLSFNAGECCGSSDYRRGVCADDRLALIDEILGKDVVDAVFAEVKAEHFHRDGWEYWQAARQGDRDYWDNRGKDRVRDEAYLQEKLDDTKKVQQVFEYLSKNPFGYRIDKSGDMWTFVRTWDGKRLVLHLCMINGSGRSLPEYSIPAPHRWTPRFGIN